MMHCIDMDTLRNFFEQVWMRDTRRAGTGVYKCIHEDSEHRATKQTNRAVNL